MLTQEVVADEPVTSEGTDARPPATTWADSVDRGVRWAVLGMAVLSLAATVLIAPRFFPDRTPTSALGFLLIGLGQLGLLTSLATGRRSSRISWGVLLLTGAGLTLTVLTMTVIPELSDTWWPRSLLISTPAYLAISTRRGWLWALGLIVLNAWLRWQVWQPNPTLPDLTLFEEVAVEVGQFVALASVALIAARVSATVGAQADAAIEVGRSGREADLVGRAGQTRLKEVDRFVHDEVLHTLRLIALDRDVIPAPTALAAATRLRQIIQMQQQAPDEHGFTEGVRAAAAEFGPGVEVIGPPGLSLPTDVASALTAATRECLRNSSKHAGADGVRVAIRRSGFALALTISDHGRGFDPTARSGRYGLRESVLARVEGIGGTARVVSAPGRGTTVSLRWSPIPTTRYAPETLGGGAIAEFVSSIAQMLHPQNALGLWSALLLARHVTWPWLAVAATVLLVVAGGWALRRGVRHGLTFGQSAALGVTAWLFTGLSIWQSPATSTHPRLLWLAVAATALISVVSLFRPVRECVVIGVGMTVILLVGLPLHDARSSPLTPYTTVIMSPLVSTVIAVLVRRIIDRCAFEVWSAEERLHDQRVGITGADVFASWLDQRLLGNRSTLVAFLDELIAAPDALSTPEAQARADRLERSLRDVIAVEIVPELGAQLIRLHRAGWVVRSRWASSPPASVQRELARVVGLLETEAGRLGPPPLATIGVVPLGDQWRVSLLVRPALDAWAAAFQPGEPWQSDHTDGLYAVAVLPG